MTERADHIFDVIIIGGGLSGLSAANYLTTNNYNNYLVLEARDRVGGRTCTINVNGHYVDVGGAYVGPTQNRILRLAREFNIKTKKVYCDGKNILTFSNNKRYEYSGTVPNNLSPFTLLDVNYLLCQTQKLSETITSTEPWSNTQMHKYDHMSVQEWINSLSETEQGKEMYASVIRGIVCVEPNELSMLAWLNYVNSGQGVMRLCQAENGAQERKFINGSQQISNKLREKLGENKIKLDCPIEKIQWDKSDKLIIIECKNKMIFQCKHVLLAIAPSLYKTIDFQPPLPEKKQLATNQMYMGSIIKTITFYSKPFWKENGYSGILLDTSTKQPVVYSYDDSFENNIHAIMGFVVAKSGRFYQKQTKDERKLAICEQYSNAFNSKEALKPINYIEQDWNEEIYSGGCYTDIMPVDLLTTIKQELRTPVAKQVYFAGTELATQWSGYMDGAVQSGEKAAFDIIKDCLNPNTLLLWNDTEQLHENEECRSLPTIGPSTIERHLPKPSTVKYIMKAVFVTIAVAIAYRVF
ncbi:unnamed protein product [Didymodactylos carnosus]|uniref:Amine oxidase n=1 Tax=Didymodactylos carnosus TaxID=1234261 RepID=A0A814NVH5_9BILA|nr:unnamed protein product [Didymodactylos carnosus]CAF1097177.1 unnamed protein product [Didymodactylos carnosus]CAF3538691.1 unnamed protein product [Didymodactylos carnosus]CAF3862373.1 unnamed protein product [Didymodactylos carnosus]